MIRPATKHGLDILGGAIAVLAVGAVAVAVLLARGPIDVGFLAPALSRFLSSSDDALDVRLDGAEIEWSRDAHALQVKLTGVSVTGTDGAPLAAVPELFVGLSSASLRERRFAPTRVKVAGAEVEIHRDADGTFAFARAEQPGAEGGGIAPLVLAWLANDQSAGGASAYLNEIEIDRARMIFTDARTGLVIEAPAAHLQLTRTQDGVVGRLEASAAVADETFALDVDILYDGLRRAGQAEARFSPVRMSHVAALAPFFEPFAIFDFPVGGVASLDLGDGGAIVRAQLSLQGEPGHLAIPVSQGEAARLAVASASMNAIYHPASGHIELEWLRLEGDDLRADIAGEMRIDLAAGETLRPVGGRAVLYGRDITFHLPAYFDGPTEIASFATSLEIQSAQAWHVDLKSLYLRLGKADIALTGEVSEGAGSPAVRLDGQITNFEAGDLGRYWPKGVVPPARDWVVPHVHSGLLTRGTLKVSVPAGAFAVKPVPDGAIQFDFAVENGVASYVEGLPPLSNVAAQMRLTGQTFNLELGRANILGTELASGHVAIDALGVKDTPITIAAAGSGPVVDLLRIIDEKPLGLISAYGAAPSDFGGAADLTFAMTIPQNAKIEVEDVVFRVDAKATGVKLPSFAGYTLDNGTVDLEVTEIGLKGVGDVRANGVPSDLQYEERFRNRGETPSSYRITARLDDGARAALGADTGDMVVGTVPVEITALGNGTKISRVVAEVDLSEAAIDLDQADFRKAAGVPLKGHIAAEVAGDGAISLSKIKLDGEGVAVAGTAHLAPDGRLDGAAFPTLRIPGLADLSVTSGRNKDGALTISVDGAYLNAAPLLKEGMKSGSKGGKSAWQFDARIAEVALRKDVTASKVAARVEATREGLQFVDVTGVLDGGADFATTLSETGEGVRRMTLTSGDAGKAVRGLTGVEAIEGGRLTLNVRLRDRADLVAAAPPPPLAGPDDAGRIAKAGDGRISGTLAINAFKVVDMPVLARLLNIGSLQGIGDLLQGEGITFTSLDMPFWMEDGLLGIDDGRAAGPAIGLTVQGVVDQKREVADLRGSIVPAFAVNSVLGYVPVVGPLLVSRKGEGVFGFTYGVAGPIAEPQLTVNPLSALAPGFLRRLFEMEEAEAHRAPEKAPAAQ